MDVHLLSLLHEFGISCEAATRRGWGSLDNGEMVSTAVAAGFTCLLTQDQLFGKSAGTALKSLPHFSVVVIRLAQKPWREYAQQFRAAWEASPIKPAPGRVLYWPAEEPHSV
jgi:hypothetical protein